MPQEGNSVLPKSVTPSRIKENLRVVQLDQEDIETIKRGCEGKRQRYCDFSEISELDLLTFGRVAGLLTGTVGYKYYAGLDDSD